MKDFSPWLILAASLLVALVWYWFHTQPHVKSYTYKKTEQGKLHLKVHYPRDWIKGDQRPTIVFFFGGGWVGGSIEQFRWQAEYFAQRGMVAVRVDYRVDSRHGTSPVQAVEDGQDAIAWIGKNAAVLGIDPEKIIVSGGSAGGHIAACIALCSDQQRPNIAGLVLLNPVLDLTTATAELEFSSRELELISELGLVSAKQLSPNFNISTHTPPTLLVIGGSDPLLIQATDFRNKAVAKNVPIVFKIAEQQNHGFFNVEPWKGAVVSLIDQYLVESEFLEPLIAADVQVLEIHNSFTDLPAQQVQP